MSIAAAIQQLSGSTADRVFVFDAEVVSVDQNKRTCKVVKVGGQSSNELTARLMTSVDDGCLMLPKVGSTVIIHMSDRCQPYVAMFSEVEEIVWLGGEYDGVPIVKHPTNVNKGLLKKINNLENKVNDLINAYNAHVHPGVTSGPSSTAVTASLVAGTLTTTQQSDIEHPKITH